MYTTEFTRYFYGREAWSLTVKETKLIFSFWYKRGVCMVIGKWTNYRTCTLLLILGWLELQVWN